MTDVYDVIVVGGGAAGENVVSYAREHGLTVALVEAELVGGECSYWACMPSKALLRPPEALAAARRVPGSQTAVTGEIDVGAVLASRDAFASHWRDQAQVDWVTGTGATLIRGAARLDGERALVVEADDGANTRLTARKAVVLATGSAAAVPPVEGLDQIRFWTSRDVTSAQRIPRRLLVLGGGVVGVEMAQAYHLLGAQEVTIVQRSDRLVPKEEPFVGEQLREVFSASGITVHTQADAVGVSRDSPDATVRMELRDGRVLSAEELLIATGRRPRTRDLGLETVGLEPGAPIAVDEHLRATEVAGDWLYAVGDVNERALFTHHGKYQARLLGDDLGGVATEGAWADERALVRVIFTDPQVGAVGLTQAQAEDAGMDVYALSTGVGGVAGGALLGEDTTGTAQLVVDRARRVIVGATFVGPGVGEMVHAATVAIVGEVGLDRLWHAVPAFPTVSEVWLRLLEADRQRR